ncbi:hypothetical protein [Staphylococcus phage vB_SauH_DELF3]|nr:hypothetical protein [Staphylococcus phage vB_SauH_DELF3]
MLLMPICATTPKFAKNKNPKNPRPDTSDGMRSEVLDNVQATAPKVENTSIKRKPTWVQATEKKQDKEGVVDLKKALAHSSKKKTSTDIGWYLTVPISIKTTKIYNSTYLDLRSLKIDSPSNLVFNITDILEGRRNTVVLSSMKPEPMTNNMTKVNEGKQHSYFITGTVSSKSPVSWRIQSRDKVNEKNFSKTTLKTVKQLPNWKMKNLN